MTVRIRPISPADVDALAELVARANATYAEWAATDWRPPGIEHERGRWRERLRDPVGWHALAAGADDRALACVSFTQAHGPDDCPIAGVAHLSRLFVDPAHWGRGLGSALLGRAVAKMGERGYLRAQLYTAAGNARSRRFYERHGWEPSEETRPWQGLLLIHYARDLR